MITIFRLSRSAFRTRSCSSSSDDTFAEEEGGNDEDGIGGDDEDGIGGDDEREEGAAKDETQQVLPLKWLLLHRSEANGYQSPVAGQLSLKGRLQNPPR